MTYKEPRVNEPGSLVGEVVSEVTSLHIAIEGCVQDSRSYRGDGRGRTLDRQSIQEHSVERECIIQMVTREEFMTYKYSIYTTLTSSLIGQPLHDIRITYSPRHAVFKVFFEFFLFVKDSKQIEKSHCLTVLDSKAMTELWKLLSNKIAKPIYVNGRG